MKRKLIMLSMLIALAAAWTPAARSDIRDLLGGKTGSTLGNILEGVFTKTDIDVKDIAGTYEATGSAVSFKSENALQKAGGVAASAAIEAQLDPYYEKYGLIGATFSADNEGNFTLQAKKITLKGVITKNDDGTFQFKFQAFGKINIGSMKAYVQKSPTSLEIMFDANKLKSLLSIVTKTVGGSLTKTVSNLLDSYDGACLGFGFKKTGAAPQTESETSVQQADTTAAPASALGDALRGLLKKK